MVDTGKTTPTGITGDENTVGFMLSRVLSGGSIYRKTELASLFPRWISDLKENKLLSPRLPELLARVLRPFGTPNAHQCIEELEVPKSFPAAHQWMSEIQILIDDKADERFLQNLECLPDRVISFEELCQQPQGKDT